MSSDYPSFEMIVVDNVSSDGSIELIQELAHKDKRIRLVSTGRKVGVGAAWNIGINKCKGNYVALLHNDTEVDSAWLKEAIKILEADESIDAICCKIVSNEKNERNTNSGVFLIKWCGWNVGRGDYDRISNVLATTVALIMRRNLIHNVGLFDTKIWLEDIDYSWRIWLRNRRLVYSPDSIVYHISGQTQTKKFSMGERHFNACKSVIRMFLKNYSIKNLFLFIPISSFFMFALGIGLLVRKNDRSMIIGLSRGIIWNLANLRDTLRHRLEIQRYRILSDDALENMGLIISISPLLIYRSFITGRWL